MWSILEFRMRLIPTILMVFLVETLGCRPTTPLGPAGGAPDYQAINFISVPGGQVNAADGNLVVRRADMSVDTTIGTQEIAATYNSASGRWLWNFELYYDGTTFIDSNGALYAVGGLPDGAPIPGSVWVKADPDTIETRGGLAYHFDAAGLIDHVRWSTLDYPRVLHNWSQVASLDVLTLQQCTAVNVCFDYFTIEFSVNGEPASVVDVETGRRVEYEHDSGRVSRVRSPLALDEGWDGTRYEYSIEFPTLLTAIINSEGERIEYVYDSQSHIADVIQVGEGNPTHHFEFKVPKNYTNGLYRTWHTNPLGGQTRYLFDDDRQIHIVKRLATEESTNIEWSALRPTRVESSVSGVTELIWLSDDLATRVDPSGNVIDFTYESGALNREDPLSRSVARIEDTVGLVEERTYDAFGRLATLANGEGEISSFTYHPGSSIASETDPLGVERTFPVYGLHGHWLDQDGASPDKRAFDSVGNVQVASILRERGGFLLQTHDADRNLSSAPSWRDRYLRRGHHHRYHLGCKTERRADHIHRTPWRW